MSAQGLTTLKSAIDILNVHCVTVADGERPPGHDLCSGDAHWDQTHQVEHDTVEVFQVTEAETKRN